MSLSAPEIRVVVVVVVPGGKGCCVFYRKLRATLDEYTTRVGQQAIVLCISPSKPNPVFKVFGAAPLENVVSVTVSGY